MHLQGEEKWYKHLAAKEIKQKQKHMMAIFVFTYFILSLLPFLQKFFRWRQTNNSVANFMYEIDSTQLRITKNHNFKYISRPLALSSLLNLILKSLLSKLATLTEE